MKLYNSFLDMNHKEKTEFIAMVTHMVQSSPFFYGMVVSVLQQAEDSNIFKGVTFNPEPIKQTENETKH